MTDPIDIDLFRHLVDLAALDLSDDEAAYLLVQLNHQLRSIEELMAIPIDPETPPAEHGVAYTAENSPFIRSDEWQPSGIAEIILEHAPKTLNGYFVVPDIPHIDL